MAKKRRNGDGCITRLPSGTWRGQIMDGYRPDGKKNTVSFTAPTKGEVQKAIRNYWLHHEKDPTPKETTMTFESWADIWYGDYKTQVQPSTYCNYKYTLRIIKEYFCSTPLDQIKPLDVNRFNDYLRDSSMSKSYMTKCRAMLIQVFDAAEANELIASNPARKSKTIKILPTLEDDDDMGKKDAFTDKEQELLNVNLPDNLTGHTIRLMLATGIRTQEALALRPIDIAEDGSSISITRAIKTVGGAPTLGPPKSKKSRRTIPVPESYRADALYLKHNGGETYVWTSARENGLYDLGTFRRSYYRELKKIPSVRLLSPHCCRHTYISNLEKKGVPIEQIARLAGHSRISTTDGYVHADLTTLASAVAVLNNSNETKKGSFV